MVISSVGKVVTEWKRRREKKENASVDKGKSKTVVRKWKCRKTQNEILQVEFIFYKTSRKMLENWAKYLVFFFFSDYYLGSCYPKSESNLSRDWGTSVNTITLDSSKELHLHLAKHGRGAEYSPVRILCSLPSCQQQGGTRKCSSSASKSWAATLHATGAHEQCLLSSELMASKGCDCNLCWLSVGTSEVQRWPVDSYLHVIIRNAFLNEA